jgi:hypothetical protein
MDAGNALSFFRLKEGIQYMNDHHRALFFAAALIVFGVCSAQAAHKDVKHCADDYRKYCHEWGLETKGLANCMHKHGDKLTNACIAALVRAGEVSQAEVDRRKKQHGR